MPQQLAVQSSKCKQLLFRSVDSSVDSTVVVLRLSYWRMTALQHSEQVGARLSGVATKRQCDAGIEYKRIALMNTHHLYTQQQLCYVAIGQSVICHYSNLNLCDPVLALGVHVCVTR
jgi:hypothetical protein